MCWSGFVKPGAFSPISVAPADMVRMESESAPSFSHASISRCQRSGPSPKPVAAEGGPMPKFPVEVLTELEVRWLIEACSNRAPTGIRNRALIAVLYRGGLRLGEALALFPKDLDAAGGTVTVLHGKGDKRRTIGLDPGAFAIVER